MVPKFDLFVKGRSKSLIERGVSSKLALWSFFIVGILKLVYFYSRYHYCIANIRGFMFCISTIIFFLIVFVCTWIIYHYCIPHITQLFLWRVRNWTPEKHQEKNGTPSMGGLVIIAVTIVALSYDAYSNVFLRLILWSLVSFGTIGFLDDYAKATQTRGLHAHTKFLLQLCAAFSVAIALYYMLPAMRVVTIPFCKQPLFIGWLSIPWAMFILVSTSNAVNLTDGLDGLAGMSLLVNFAVYGIIALVGSSIYDDSLLTAVLHALAVLGGSTVAFLWYNTYPATIMMGDVGALPLGAALASVALILRQEILLPITGILFVIETLSVILQVYWFKRYKKRILKRAPLHHHFELSGWSEPKIVMRCTFISLVMGMLAVMLSMC